MLILSELVTIILMWRILIILSRINFDSLLIERTSNVFHLFSVTDGHPLSRIKISVYLLFYRPQ